MDKVIILGAGMAGYGAAKKLTENNVPIHVFEKENHYGGHCASYTFDKKWIFDDGPHISFTKSQEVKELFARNVENDFYEFEANVDNFWKGKWVKHPAQINLHGLAPELNTQILLEMIETKKNTDPVINNYQDWLYASYGKTFAENFPMKYTRKFHTTEAKNMTTDWLGPRLYQPDLAEVVYGMLSPSTDDVHYIKGFRYPNNGGYVSFMKGIESIKDVHYNEELTSINLKNKIFKFKSGREIKYSNGFSSLPLNHIISLMEDAPNDIKESAKKLAWTKCVVVNFGVNRTNISPSHWRYVYDEDLYSTRLSFPSMFGPGNAPSGMSSVQVEIYFSDKYKRLDKSPEDFIPIIKSELIHMGILKPNDEILIQNAWLSPYAQIVFDHERKENVDKLHAFLLENNILFGGRFAEWSYAWSDESLLAGERGATEIINQL